MTTTSYTPDQLSKMEASRIAEAIASSLRIDLEGRIYKAAKDAYADGYADGEKTAYKGNAQLLEAALELTACHKTNSNGHQMTIADAIGQAIGLGSSDVLKAWGAFVLALDHARAAESPCDDCDGRGEVPKTCCTGSLARIECGCHGEPVPTECTSCAGRGWVA